MQKKIVAILAAGGAFMLALQASPAAAQSDPLPQPIEDIGQGIGNAVRGVFNFLGELADPKSGEFKAHVEAGRHAQAAAFYLQNEAELSKSESAKALLEKLVAALNASRDPQAAPLAERLAAVRPASPATWPRARESFAAARKVIAAYDEIALLKRPEHRSPAIQRLEQALSQAEGAFAAAASESFAQYDHASNPTFFDAYPVALDATSREMLLRQGAEHWIQALGRSSEAQAEALMRQYAPALESAQRGRLASAYADMLRRSRGWSDPLAAGQALQLAKALRQAGLREGMAATRVRIVVLYDTAAAPLDWSAHELGFPATRLSQRDLPGFVRQLEKEKPAEVIALLDPHRVLAHHGTASVTRATARRLTGYRTEPNPQWERARVEVESSRQTLTEVQEKHQESQKQAQELAKQSQGSGFAMLGAMAGSGLSTYALSAAQQDLRNAEQRLRATPQTIRVPEYRDYAHPIARIEGLKRQEVGVYLIEAASSRYWRGALREERNHAEDFRLAVHSQDPDRPKADADNQAAKARLATYLKGQVLLPAASVWERLEGETIVPDQPLGRLHQTVMADIRAWRLLADEEIARRDAASKVAQTRVAQFAGN